MSYKDLIKYSCILLTVLATSAQSYANERTHFSFSDGIISDIKLLGKGCETGSALSYDELTGNINVSFTELKTVIDAEINEDRSVCLLKYTVNVPANKQAIIPPAIVKGNVNISENSKTVVSLRYRYAGDVGPASIWEFNGTASGEMLLKKGLAEEMTPCGKTSYLKLSIILNTRNLDPTVALTSSQTTRVDQVTIPPVTFEDCPLPEDV
ncbi:DUF4360 domain-containing protein [Zooshikella marina]|uniref:DUF4360 domain-containing protein n=1 Tax=Zooshikella ganghwensis TaxID=202772 RepID=UPI0004033850|nr:DUF4360 domain-containing protein [Zooshikella ganghwensis]MBU2708319.1 DUF4360 domain-containing protein [Zooshikella ganghwensis]